jgi:hypothetical protein
LKKIIFFCILLVTITACQQSKKPTMAFYYWKTVFKLSALEKETLQENEVKKLYIRYFDIDLDSKTQEPFPRSPIHFDENTNGFVVVPVVYIKNSVMLEKNIDVEDLAKKTNSFINQINAKNDISVSEIQIDCDWTLLSRENYLKFLEHFKAISQKSLSATIRLHQIKYYKKTKIPNVDKGVLMYYNMGKIAPDSLNSIYERNIANAYLASLKKYPLPINMALPIYSWAIHIRDGKVIGLKNKIDFNTLKKDTNFVQIKESWYKVKSSNYKNGSFFLKNDLLKLEAISTSKLLEMAEDLEEHTETNPEEIIFYDLDAFNIKKYEKDIFKKVINQF